MAKAMQYPAYPQQAAVERVRPAQPTPAAQAATRRVVKIGPLVLIACLILVILAVLTIPMMVGGTASVSSRAAAVSEAQPLASTSYDSVQEAVASLGFSNEVVAGLPEDATVTAAAVVDGSCLELTITYGKGSYLYRATAGSDDLSGVDYDTIAFTSAEELEGTTIGYTGVSEKKLTSAVWISGDYSFALVSESGVDAAEMRGLAEIMA